MEYVIGIKAIKALCEAQDKFGWQQARLSSDLFNGQEKPLYQLAVEHLKQHHVLPSLPTLQAQFPDIDQINTPEPPSYYVQQLETRFFYNCLSYALGQAQDILKHNQGDHEKALKELMNAAKKIRLQKYRSQILDVGLELPKVVLGAYHNVAIVERVSQFGWPYMDEQSGGVMPGDVISFVGRPAAGKTWLTLWTALHNWRSQGNQKGVNTLFVSMEMSVTPIGQRIASLYTGATITQLKNSGFSSIVYKKFVSILQLMNQEEAKFYVMDGNLATSVEDIYQLADNLGCQNIVIDGAYLVRHPNPKLDRFIRAAENVELMKRYTTDLQVCTFASWQFNREASKKNGKKSGEEIGLDNIGYSDAIGQISSVVLGLLQDDEIDAMKSRKIRVLKGRNGETGQFTIHWDFNTMNFRQSDPPTDDTEHTEPPKNWCL